MSNDMNDTNKTIEKKFDNLKLKQILIENGFYEIGMSTEDMRESYKTLQMSKCTANREKEYRELLSQTEKNCGDIKSLIEETITSDIIEADNLRNEDVGGENESNSDEKNVELSSCKNINNFFVYKETSNSLNLQHNNKISPLYYHHPAFLKLPVNERARKIQLYFVKLSKINYFNKEQPPVEWNKPIVPLLDKKFNGDLCIDYVPDIEDIENNIKENIIPRRNVKRINYKDLSDDEINDSLNVQKNKKLAKRKNFTDDIDDDFKESLHKKTKTTSNKNNKILETETSAVIKVSNRTKKMFEKLKDNKENEREILILPSTEDSDLSDSDEIFPTVNIPVTVHNEETEISTESQGKNGKQKNNRFTEQNKRKHKLDLRNNNKSTSKQMTQCPICSKFFPNTEIEDHASKCEQFSESENETLCIICNKYFPQNEIDQHKVKCLNEITDSSVCNNDSSKLYLCNICDKYIVKSQEIDHASNCIAVLKD